MSVIQLEIEEPLVQEMGMQAIREFMERQLAYLRLQYLGAKISTAIQNAGFDHAQEVAEARKEAWQEYKQAHLQGGI